MSLIVMSSFIDKLFSSLKLQREGNILFFNLLLHELQFSLERTYFVIQVEHRIVNSFQSQQSQQIITTQTMDKKFQIKILKCMDY